MKGSCRSCGSPRGYRKPAAAANCGKTPGGVTPMAVIVVFAPITFNTTRQESAGARDHPAGPADRGGRARLPQQELDSFRPNSLFGSMLEKKFVDRLRAFVADKHGTWEQTIIRGSQGFRFSILGWDRLWELELQPQLGAANGIAIASQPDFLLRCDDEKIKPIAIFTDGFQYHCHPVDRLADDMGKRRAIIDSGSHHVWNITWDDLEAANSDHTMVAQAPIARMLEQFALAFAGRFMPCPTRGGSCATECSSCWLSWRCRMLRAGPSSRFSFGSGRSRLW